MQNKYTHQGQINEEKIYDVSEICIHENCNLAFPAGQGVPAFVMSSFVPLPLPLTLMPDTRFPTRVLFSAQALARLF
jgi:hypothetical protein